MKGGAGRAGTIIQNCRNMKCACGYEFKCNSNDEKLLKTLNRLHGKKCKLWRENAPKITMKEKTYKISDSRQVLKHLQK